LTGDAEWDIIESIGDDEFLRVVSARQVIIKQRPKLVFHVTDIKINSKERKDYDFYFYTGYPPTQVE
jgi:hypothetical protein